MKIKVNRVNTIDEFDVLQLSEVDICCFSVDRIYESDKTELYDSRAVSIEKLRDIIRIKDSAEIAIHINYYNESPELLDLVEKEIAPEYLNVFLQLFDSGDPSWKKYYAKSLEVYNRLKIPLIIFGDGIGYDTHFNFKKENIQIIKRLAFQELNCFTLNSNHELCIKTKDYWGIKQSNTSDLLMETVQSYLKVIPTLIDEDELTPETAFSDLSFAGAKGLTLSLKSKEKDIFNTQLDQGAFLSKITSNYYAMEELLKIIAEIKKASNRV